MILSPSAANPDLSKTVSRTETKRGPVPSPDAPAKQVTLKGTEMDLEATDPQGAALVIPGVSVEEEIMQAVMEDNQQAIEPCPKCAGAGCHKCDWRGSMSAYVIAGCREQTGGNE